MKSPGCTYRSPFGCFGENDRSSLGDLRKASVRHTYAGLAQLKLLAACIGSCS